MLKEHVLRQHAGWSPGSNMATKYVHYYGNESNENILEAYGLKPKNQEINKLQPVQCPNCSEPNQIESKFCVKCRMILSYDMYTHTTEEKQQQDDALVTLSDIVMKLMAEVQQLKTQSHTN